MKAGSPAAGEALVVDVLEPLANAMSVVGAMGVELCVLRLERPATGRPGALVLKTDGPGEEVPDEGAEGARSGEPVPDTVDCCLSTESALTLRAPTLLEPPIGDCAGAGGCFGLKKSSSGLSSMLAMPGGAVTPVTTSLLALT